MQYKVDFDIENFEFWAGAKDVFDRCVQEDKLEDEDCFLIDYITMDDFKEHIKKAAYVDLIQKLREKNNESEEAIYEDAK